MSISIPKSSGIYKITCTANGRFYIGSSNNCKRRWGYHKRDLRKNSHHSPHLQRAWNKYGEETFIFEIIEFVMPWILLEREQYWLDTLQPFDEKGFNISKMAEYPDYWKGRKHTPETRAKMRESQLGHTLSPEGRAKISNARKGTKRDPLVTEKIASKIRGKKHSPEHIAKVVARHLGSKRSPKTCQNIGASKSKNYIAVSPSGEIIKIHNLKQFCRDNGFYYTSFSKVANGQLPHYRKWKCYHEEDN